MIELVLAAAIICAPDAPVILPVSASVLEHAPKAMPPLHRDAIARGVEVLLSMQEGTQFNGAPSEWPYQGVYRVAGKIPIGYRVGGTGICGEALLRSPGFASDERRKAAVDRAIGFICSTVDEPLMDPDYRGGYDVRGWGFCYGLRLLLAARELDIVPEPMTEQVDDVIESWTAAIQKIEIPEVGGWTYSRRGIDEPCSMSPFMTAPCLQTLYEAAVQGEAVDPAVVARGLAALERSRSASGNVLYSAKTQSTEDAGSIPGAMGRMTAVEAILARSDRSTPERLAFAVDAFIEHWNELEKRRRKNGTHKAPYGVAPYYFFYAHRAAADAMQMLPGDEQDERRTRINELLFSVREADGRWNDRVFDRSANYGTAMSMLSLLQPFVREPAGMPTAAAETPPHEPSPGAVTPPADR